MRTKLYILASAIAVSTAVGCGSSTTTDDAALTTPIAVDGSKFLLAEEPDDAVGVIETLETVDDGAPVVVVGRIGGAENPWITGRAAFMLLDASKMIVAEGQENEEGELCLGDCCAAERAGCTTLVKVVDANGAVVPADARQLLGVTDADTVVVRGKATKDENGNVAVLAEGVYIRR